MLSFNSSFVDSVTFISEYVMTKIYALETNLVRKSLICNARKYCKCALWFEKFLDLK